MSCYDGLGNLADGRPFWHASFSPPLGADLLFYYPGDGRWWLGTLAAAQLTWQSPGSTSGLAPADPDFGQVWDGRPFWVGDFNADGRAEILFYFPGDGNWWLGTFTGSPPTLSWNLAGNTNNFGQIWDGRPFWISDFNGDGRAEVLFYFPGDGNWWLGTFTGNPPALGWSLAGNTSSFGQVWDGRPFWIADFNGDNRADVLFYFPGDGNWWLGTFSGTPPTLSWQLTGNTNNFGQVWDGRPFWIADFNGDGRAEILFHFPGDGNWWLGNFSGTPPAMAWSLVGNTNNFGQVWDGRPFWVANLRGTARAEVLFYFPGDGNWWLGTFVGSPPTLSWSLISNTNNFGQVYDGRPFWVNDFNGDGLAEILFYFPGDGNWWLGLFPTRRATTLTWNLIGNTGQPYDSRLGLHVKIINNSIPAVPITTMVNNMQQLFVPAGILVDWLTTENLSIPFLADVAVSTGPPPCSGDELTDEQVQLFENRNNAGSNDVVVYYVRSTVPPLNGCAAHPSSSPGAIVTAGASQWTLAHEVGHVLGLNHPANEMCPPAGPSPTVLMTGCGTALIVGTPTIDQSEIETMQDSDCVEEC